jgi:hypothetical protein
LDAAIASIRHIEIALLVKPHTIGSGKRVRLPRTAPD